MGYNDAGGYGDERKMGGGPGVGPGGIYDSYTAGAAGIGVARARSMRSDGGYAAGLQEGAAPYVAFAVPCATARSLCLSTEDAV